MTQLVPVAEIPKMVADGKIKHSLVVVALYYFFDKSLYEIGRTLSISPQRASQLHVAALRNLRKVLHAASLG